MNKFLILAAILATTFARPGGLIDGHDGHVSVSHNSIGTYRYDVQLRDSSRTEERFADGSVVGEYTLIDANGVPQTYKYTAGVDGFKIIEGALPVAPLPVEDTPEVIAARIAAPVEVLPAAPVEVLPAAPNGLILPVEETAKAHFLAGAHA